MNLSKILHTYENNEIEFELKLDYYDKEINNIKLKINENYNIANNLKEELINIQKEKNIIVSDENNREINNLNSFVNSYNNIYPKNDIKNEISYLKRFINMFMLETRNENKKERDILSNSLNDKINIIEINNVLKEISNDMNNKVNVDLFYKHIQIQNDINNLISKEHIVGKWVSHKSTPMKSTYILWDEQLINTAPNNYCFSPNNSHILIKEKGIYLIKIIIFNEYQKNNPMNNIQLLIDRKKAYNYSNTKSSKMINNEVKNNLNNYEESIIFEECIQIKDICRVEIRLDGFNFIDNEMNLRNSLNDSNKRNDNIKAILNIISL